MPMELQIHKLPMEMHFQTELVMLSPMEEMLMHLVKVMPCRMEVAQSLMVLQMLNLMEVAQEKSLKYQSQLVAISASARELEEPQLQMVLQMQ